MQIGWVGVVLPLQRVDQPRRIELERGAVGTVLRDLIAIDPLRRSAVRRLLEQHNVAEAGQQPIGA
jgi:hypothetical protein